MYIKYMIERMTKKFKKNSKARSRNGYIMVLSVVIVSTSLLLLFYIFKMNTQQSRQNSAFIENRRTYYYLKALSILAEDELLKRANTPSDKVFSIFHLGKKLGSTFLLSDERKNISEKMSSFMKFPKVRLSFSIIDLTHLKNKSYIDLDEYAGKYKISIFLKKDNVSFRFESISSYTQKNILPPYVNFFSFFSKNGFYKNINMTKDPRKCVIFNNNKGILYAGNNRVDYRLCAGLEEFRLPHKKYSIVPEGIKVMKYFCFSYKYRNMIKNISDFDFSKFQLFGTNDRPSYTAYLGDGYKQFIGIPAIYKRNSNTKKELGKYSILYADTSIFSEKISLGLDNKNIIYNPFSEKLHIIHDSKKIFFMGSISDIDVLKALKGKIDINIRKLNGHRNIFNSYQGYSILDLKGRIISVDNPIILENVHIVSPGMIICKNGFIAKNIHSDVPFSLLSKGKSYVSGNIDGYIIDLEETPSLSSKGNFTINGGLAANIIDPDGFEKGGNINYNNIYYDYFNKCNYWVVKKKKTGAQFYYEK